MFAVLALTLLVETAAPKSVAEPPKPAEPPKAADAGKPAEAPKTAETSKPATPDTPLDFTAEARLLFRVVACAGDAKLPDSIDAKVVEAHCKELDRRVEKYRATWVKDAIPFLQSLKPEGLPKTVVYPFGGGDLISALTTYPEATEITTLSLEHAGDPRRIHTVTSAELKASLDLIRQTSAGLLVANDSKTAVITKYDELLRGVRFFREIYGLV